MTNRGWQRLSKLAAGALAATLLLGACGGGDDDDASKKKDDKSTETTGKQSPSTTTPALPAGTTYFATATAPKVDIFDSADGTTPIKSMDKPTAANEPPLVFLVDGTDISSKRLPVLLPYKPNGGKGWIEASTVKLSQNPYAIKIELGAHKLTLTQGTKTIIETQVGLGKPGKETPTGEFFLVKLYKNPNPTNVYGPWAYSTSAYSHVTDPEFLEKFPEGQIGIHGNNDPSSIGANVSNGCIRLPNDAITQMAKILPLGTPVEIVA